jgi:hypothetical protein
MVTTARRTYDMRMPPFAMKTRLAGVAAVVILVWTGREDDVCRPEPPSRDLRYSPANHTGDEG